MVERVVESVRNLQCVRYVFRQTSLQQCEHCECRVRECRQVSVYLIRRNRQALICHNAECLIRNWETKRFRIGLLTCRNWKKLDVVQQHRAAGWCCDSICANTKQDVCVTDVGRTNIIFVRWRLQ